jgi:N-acetylglucosamine malate deacetylase 2
MIGASSALVVIAHPDDESFGLGAVIDRLAAGGTEIGVLCMTRGEASTLGATPQLAEVREHELASAAAELGVERVRLLDFPDGALADVSPEVLDAIVEDELGDAELLVVFEPSGVTGHPDHRAATAAAERVAGRRGLPVLEWGVPGEVADRLNAEMGTGFVGFDGEDVLVQRSSQWRAISCHESQATDNPVLVRRLELQGDLERVHLRAGGSAPRMSAAGEAVRRVS